MAQLAKKKCISCSAGTPALTAEEIKPLKQQVKNWEVVDNHQIKKRFKFPDFKTGLDFVNRVGEIAENEDHHPDILLAWGKVEIVSWTHKANGLTENDFILAAKIDQID